MSTLSSFSLAPGPRTQRHVAPHSPHVMPYEVIHRPTSGGTFRCEICKIKFALTALAKVSGGLVDPSHTVCTECEKVVLEGDWSIFNLLVSRL